MGADTPKQYIVIAGKPLLVHTLQKFEAAGIDGIILAVPSGDVSFVKNDIIGKYGIEKVMAVVPGGKERQDSVRAGLEVLPEGTDVVAVHDAVRPFVSSGLIRSVIEQAAAFSAAVLGVPVKDTVKRVTRDNIIFGTLERNELWLTQTPQAFRAGVILEAYRRAYEEGFYATDEAALVERIGVKIRMVPGAYENIKITTADDIRYAEFIMEREVMK
jgi:2-C-methyl-D-erythritol 4-phosphate cytidylyltransferase